MRFYGFVVRPPSGHPFILSYASRATAMKMRQRWAQALICAHVVPLNAPAPRAKKKGK